MKTLLSLLFTFALSTTLIAQEYYAGLRLGVSNTYTDIGGQNSGALINSNIETTRFAATGFFENRFKPFYSLSADVNWTTLFGSDKYAKVEGKRIRNVMFNTPVVEIAVMNNFNLFELFQVQTSSFVYPSAALGFSLIYFNPKAADGTNTNLQPLGTAGQALPSSDYGKYSKWTTAIIYQLGAETKDITSGTFESFSFGLSFSFHQTFTDYIDDTGHDLYIDPETFFENDASEETVYYAQPGEKHAWHRGGKKNDWYSLVRFTVKKKLNATKGRSSL